MIRATASALHREADNNGGGPPLGPVLEEGGEPYGRNAGTFEVAADGELGQVPAEVLDKRETAGRNVGGPP